MESKRGFFNGAVYKICNYVWWFLLANAYFVIVNIPMIINIFALGNTEVTGINVFLFICLIPLGPAFSAMFTVMGKLVRDKEVNVTKEFFKGYKRNFWESLFFWLFQLVVLSVIYIDLLYLNTTELPVIFKYLIMAAAFIIGSIGLYAFPIISRFYLKVSDVIKLSIKYTFKRFDITMLNWLTIVAIFLVLTRVNNVLFLFATSIAGYLIMYYEVKVLDKIEEELSAE
ncbi:YesL family protein [Clostridium cellulovorans]|uniref:Integral membrane protein n=1 Tax=Clostridium cellulovorans (strain ATCC 35296 / DSM 3052 / OCM 3 / 743B) TaxID=573061 RepID=D9SR81_CLOC7|nr:DUF624 domain-containing protein [Clostridium cellulovorans]ADL50369.1 protein of unknown function DUF624 [Clostridium cellulovorans 743B]